jgi:hypothetical protein
MCPILATTTADARLPYVDSYNALLNHLNALKADISSYNASDPEVAQFLQGINDLISVASNNSARVLIDDLPTVKSNYDPLLVVTNNFQNLFDDWKNKTTTSNF